MAQADTADGPAPVSEAPRRSTLTRKSTEHNRHISISGDLQARDEKHKTDDVEAQKLLAQDPMAPKPTTAAEYSVPTRTKLLYLAGYFALNLSLTIYNKAVLGGVCLRWLFILEVRSADTAIM